MKPKIVVVEDLRLYPDQEKRLVSLGEVTFYDTVSETEEEWLNRCKDADIICSGIFGLKRANELNNVFISLPFVGAAECLDKEKLKQKNSYASNSPGCNKEAVAEWHISMILSFFRRLPQLMRTTETIKKKILVTAPSLYNKKITILGAGNIGKQLGKYCEAFDMTVTYFKRGDDLLRSVKSADIIANCLSLNIETVGLLDKKFFDSLKKGSFFISSSRPQICDIQALKKALDNETLIGAADDAASLEVGDVNEKDYQNLLDHPKILVTPHIAWNTDSDRRKGNDILIDNIEAWIKEEPINLL
jgi:glycerate dehydrogenase